MPNTTAGVDAKPALATSLKMVGHQLLHRMLKPTDMDATAMAGLLLQSEANDLRRQQNELQLAAQDLRRQRLDFDRQVRPTGLLISKVTGCLSQPPDENPKNEVEYPT